MFLKMKIVRGKFINDFSCSIEKIIRRIRITINIMLPLFLLAFAGEA